MGVFSPRMPCARLLIGLGFRHSWLSRKESGVGGWVRKERLVPRTNRSFYRLSQSNLVGAYSLPPYLPSSVSVPIVLCTLNSRRWNQTFGARWFSPVYVRTVCVNLVLYVGPVLYSVLILFLKIKATIRDCRKKFSRFYSLR